MKNPFSKIIIKKKKQIAWRYFLTSFFISRLLSHSLGLPYSLYFNHRMTRILDKFSKILTCVNEPTNERTKPTQLIFYSLSIDWRARIEIDPKMKHFNSAFQQLITILEQGFLLLLLLYKPKTSCDLIFKRIKHTHIFMWMCERERDIKMRSRKLINLSSFM